MAVKVVIADDHPIYRIGIKSLLEEIPEIKITGEAENGFELLKLVQSWNPDIVLMDIMMPLLDGIECCKILTQKHPHIRIIAITMVKESEALIKIMEAGAQGYLLKHADKLELIDAIFTVKKGFKYYDTSTSFNFATMLAESKMDYKSKKNPNLTVREKQVIELICKEYLSKEIALELGLSVRTIEIYRNRIIQKLNVRNTAGIVIYAIKNKLYKY
jgi:DNA-binding NarL/FixJ family response regulator